MPGTTFDLVTIDCPDPRALAAFWGAALDLVVTEDEDDGRWLVLADAGPSGTRRIGLQRSTDLPRASAVHLDLRCMLAAFDDELARLTGLGAELLSPVRTEPYGRIANLRDPAGTPFDLCAYD